MRGLPVRAEDRRYLNIPVSRVTYCRVRGPPEPSGATRLRGFDRRPSVCISGASPEVRPKAAFERPEVFNFHYPLATLAHELQLAVEVQNLDAVAASVEDAAQHVIVVSEACASRAQLRLQCFNG